MNTHTPPGEVRPSTTPPAGPPAGTPVLSPGHVVDALRRRSRDVIEPADCRLGPRCTVCRWRLAGLMEVQPHGRPPVVRESGPPEAFCPGCNAYWCACPPPGYEDAAREHDYALGHDHGSADGPENRPSRRWLTEAGVDADDYLAGYDDACDGLPLVA